MKVIHTATSTIYDCRIITETEILSGWWELKINGVVVGYVTPVSQVFYTIVPNP